MRLVVIVTTDVIFLLLYSEMSQHSEALYNYNTFQVTNVWCYKNYS